jgi:hypothetical protein
VAEIRDLRRLMSPAATSSMICLRVFLSRARSGPVLRLNHLAGYEDRGCAAGREYFRLRATFDATIIPCRVEAQR